MKRYKIISLLIILAFTQVVKAQNMPFELKSFDFDKTRYKTALKAFKAGNNSAEMGYYSEALNSYLKSYALIQNNDELNYAIGKCYLNTANKYKCLQYFKKAFELNRAIDRDIHLMLARGLHLNKKFKEAINEYKAHLGRLSPKELQEQKEEIDKYIDECEVGVEIAKKPSNALVDNLEGVNSQYNEHSPLISADESMMIFTSTRENGQDIGPEGQYDEDIYISHKNNKSWSFPKNIGSPVNTKFNDATVGLAPDGQKLLIYNGNKGNGDIQICNLNGNEWDYPKNLPKTINTKEQESSACFSPDGNRLFFISDRPGGFGGKDIYVSYKNAKGKWDDPINMGSTINSQYDEEAVFMHPDERKLYFSSKGHNSTGGYDIFVSYLNDDNKWSEPENLGYPINSPDNDLCFVVSANGRHGYFSSSRSDSKGGLDIYRATFIQANKPLVLCNEDNLIAVRENPIGEQIMEESVEIKTIRLTIVKGLVIDAFSKKPVAAQIDIVDNNTGKVIFVSKTNSATGKFLVTLPSGKNYALTVKADGYLFHSENFNIPPASEYQEIEKTIELNNLKKDAKIVLNNVFFETGSAKLKPISYAELGRLAKLLTDHPTLKIEISGHTDNVGSYKTNQRLSEARAKSVVDFLIVQGIDTGRLKYMGYAFDQPIADNSTKEGRARNRRVEFKVLEN